MAQLDATGTSMAWVAAAGLCPNGLSLNANLADGRLLMTSQPSCGGAGGAITDVVDVWDGHVPRTIGRYVNPAQFVSGATW